MSLWRSRVYIRNVWSSWPALKWTLVKFCVWFSINEYIGKITKDNREGQLDFGFDVILDSRNIPSKGQHVPAWLHAMPCLQNSRATIHRELRINPRQHSWKASALPPRGSHNRWEVCALTSELYSLGSNVSPAINCHPGGKACTYCIASVCVLSLR